MRYQIAFEAVKKMIQRGLQNKKITSMRNKVFNAPEEVEEEIEFMSRGGQKK